MWAWIILIVVVLLAVGLYFLYRYGTKLQRRQDEAQLQMKQMEQTTSMLVIDKKMLPMKDSGLPQMVIDQTPKYMRRSKVPIVKAKVGPRVMTLMCDPKIFDAIPVKKEVKAVVAGIYITGVKGIRARLEKKPEKKKWYQRFTGFKRQAKG